MKRICLLPEPKSVAILPGRYAVPRRGVLCIGDRSLFDEACEVRDRVLPGFTIHAARTAADGDARVRLDRNLTAEAYRLRIDAASGIDLAAGGAAGAFYGVQTLRQIARQSRPDRLPCLAIEDAPDFRDRGIYYDVCRGRVPKVERLLELAEELAAVKINHLQLNIEHTFAFRGHPAIGRGASPLTAEDILRLDEHCRRRHIELVPSLACFGHLSTVLGPNRQYHRLAEDEGVGRYRDPEVAAWMRSRARRGWSLAPARPEVYEFLESLFDEFLPLFVSKRFNVCCDETYDLGAGQSYDLCRRRGKGRVYLDHILRLRRLAARHGKRIMFWGDIIRKYPELIPEIPKDVTVLDWGYSSSHPFDRIRDFAKAGVPFCACPGTSSWVSLFPRLPESSANIAAFARAGREAGAQGLLTTDWGDGGHYNFMEYSWYGYLFGAEQAWNTAARTAHFAERFLRTMFGDAAPGMAGPLRRLGELAHLSVQGRYQSVWLHLFTAGPGDAIFGQVADTDASVCVRGRIATRRVSLDAAYGRRAREELRGVRRALARMAGRGADRLGLLPYWVFAADTMAHAAGRLAAFGTGGCDTAAARRGLRAELKALRARFVRLWMARNRRSEIRVTLARYRRALAALDRARPGARCFRKAIARIRQ